MKYKIQPSQTFLFILGQSIGMFDVIESFIAEDAGKDLWIAILLAFLIGILLSVIVFKLSQQYPNETIIEYLPKLWGRVIGKFICIAFIVNFFLIGITLVKGTIDSIKAMYPDTPPTLLMILLVFMACYALYKGLNCFVNVNNFLSFITVTFMIVALIAISPEVEFTRVLPILSNGFNPILKGLHLMLAIVINTCLLIGMLLPHIEKPQQALKRVTSGFLLSGLFQTTVAIFYLAFYNLELLTEHFIHPLFNLLRYIYITRFLHGFEIMFMIVWLSLAYFLFTGFIFPAVYGLAQLLKLQDYRSLLYPYASLLIVLAVIIPNPSFNNKLFILFNKTISIGLGVVIFFSWIISLFKKQNSKTKAAEA